MSSSRVSSSVSLPPFQQLLDVHGREVHRFLVATVGPLDADDCYQETWLSALRAYPRLKDARNLRSWIFTVAHRKAIDHLRARKRRPDPTDEVPQSAAPGAPAAETRPDEELWQSVRELPTKQRTAVALKYVLDAPYDEIAAAMGTSAEAARRNVHEALKRLRMEYS